MIILLLVCFSSIFNPQQFLHLPIAKYYWCVIMSAPAPIEVQYESALYSDFVESPNQRLLYSAYFHYSLFHLLNPIITSKSTNLRVMDMACGNACIGRKIKLLNPSISVVGVDQSGAMLEEAQRLISEQGLNKNFSLFKCNVNFLPEEIGFFHCIVSGFFLAHAPTRRELFAYFQTISDHLLPGGFTVHVIPMVDHLIPEGKCEKVRLEVHQLDGSSDAIELFDYHWSERTYRNAASTAGLTEVSCQPGAVCPRGLDSGLPSELPQKIMVFSARKP